MNRSILIFKNISNGINKLKYNQLSIKTCLYDFHVKHGGKIVDFAGFLMPVQYSDLSITDSHFHTRKSASLFDVSHMLQTKVIGNDRESFMESLTVSDIKNLDFGKGTLSLFTNVNGGIEDDLIITKTQDDYLYVVSNAGCLEKDLAYMKGAAETFRQNGKDVEVEVIKNGLLALQGPHTKNILQPLIDFEIDTLSFMSSRLSTISGIKCRITRCGYTGEDGVEISLSEADISHLAELLLKHSSVKLAGLGARDTLRLEAGLCLYGNDIDKNTTPVEAGLIWTISKRRRKEGNFPGSEIINKQIKDKAEKKRVGFISEGAPIRDGTLIYDFKMDKIIGKVTSGCPSPTLKKNICMGYVATEHSNIGNTLKFKVRKNFIDGIVTKMPFVASNYFHGK